MISALEQQAYPLDAFEVIVISDGSTDGTDAYLEAPLPDAATVVYAGQSGSRCRSQLGIKKAGGEFIVFIDDDLVPSLNCWRNTRARTMRQTKMLWCSGRAYPKGFEMAPWVRWEQEMLMKQYQAMLRGDWPATARQFYTGNASLRRSHLLAAGGFDEGFRRAEDVELAYRLADKGLGFDI